MAYRISRPASRDIRRIFAFSLERFGRPQAERYASEMKQTFELLATRPMIGRDRSDIRPSVRTFPCVSHVVVYQVLDDGVRILRVRHAGEDWHGSPIG